MNTLKIAFRNTLRQKKRSFLLGGAIAFGIFIVSLIGGLTGGLVDNVRENFSHLRAGQIFISGRELSPSGRPVEVIRDDEALMDAISELEYPVKYVTRRSAVMGTLIFGTRELNQSIDGVKWDTESYFKEKLILNRGSLAELADPKALILSENAAKKLGIEVGETLLVRLATATGQQNVDEFKLIATTVDQSFFSNMTAYAHLDYLNTLLNLGSGEYQSLNIFLEDLEQMEPAAVRLRQLLAARVQMAPVADEETGSSSGNGSGRGRGIGMVMGASVSGGANPMAGLFGRGLSQDTWEGTRYSVSTLDDMLGMVTAMVGFLNTFALVILIILLLITMVGITNTFRMILIERVREIGTMRAIGMQQQSVRNIFLLEALFVCLSGALAGLVIAFIVMFGLSLVSFGTGTPLFLMLDRGHPTFKPQALQVIINIALIIICSLLAALSPARKAARLAPVKALGTHY